jgi:GT2 family glycosyltransferase
LSPENRPDLSVSIATTNHRDMLRDCVRSVFEGIERVTIEVFVIDSGSTDGTVEMLRREFPQVHVITNDRFPGFSAAHNQALHRSTGRHVMILNDDTVVHHAALDRLVAFLDDHEEAGAVGPRLLNEDGTHQRSSYVGFPTPWSELYTRAAPISWIWGRKRERVPDGTDYIDHFGVYNGNRLGTRRVKHLMGAAIAVPRTVLEQVGYLDEGFFLSYEDQDWCKRIEDAGWQVIYFPEAVITHFGNVSTRHVEQFSDIFLASRHRFQRKHFGPMSAALVRPLFNAIALVNKVWSKALVARRRFLSRVGA